MLNSFDHVAMPKRILGLFVIFFLFPAGFFAIGNTHSAERAGNSGDPSECRDACYARFADYLVFIREDPSAGGLRVLEIRKSGIEVFVGPAGIWEILDTVSDLTGDGLPNLAVSYFSLGAHCCTTFYLFEFGDRFSVIEKIHTGNSDVAFTDMDADGIPELSLWDDTFAWWNYSSFAQTPTPRIVLSFRNGRYRMAHGLMRRPEEVLAREWCDRVREHGGGKREKELCKDRAAPPTFVEIARAIRADEPWQRGEPSPTIWDLLLYLIYTGNAAKAWSVLESVWPREADDWEGFKLKMLSRLSSSPYYKELKQLNRSAL